MTAVLLRPPSWTSRAACDGLATAEADPWNDDGPALLERARAVCGGCPVQDVCLDDAVTRGEAYGVRGGLTPAERADVARLRGLPRASPAGRWQHGTAAGVKAHGCGCGPCRAAHARDVAAWRARRRNASPATRGGRLVVVTFELTRPVGAGRRRAFPGQLALAIGDTP